MSNYKISTYQEALDYLSQQLPMFQKKGNVALKKGLRNIEALDEALGHPHAKYPCIHIAGTNGKGSVAHILSAILQSAGFKVGLYTSPHYKDFRERIKVNGHLASKEYIIRFLNRIQKEIGDIHPSFFELSVAMAFQYFAEQEVDLAIIETGLGGRTDSTNIIQPVLSVITNISFDHQHVLGETLSEIAGHKAGIIKNGIPVVIGEWHKDTYDVFEREANEKKSPLYFAEKYWNLELKKRDPKGSVYKVNYKGEIWEEQLFCQLHGDYQSNNLRTAFQSLSVINDFLLFGKKILKEAILSGLTNLRELTHFIGRWQILQQSPLVIVDSAHNIGGIAFMVHQLSELKYQHLHFVLGMVKEKKSSDLIKILPPEATYYFTKANIPRGMPANELAQSAYDNGLKGEIYPSVTKAFKTAMVKAEKEDIVFVGGSIYVVAEIEQLY